MYLFIFESIGMQELIMIGTVALIFLGPRKLPQMAKKVGKIMADFRKTTDEFKNTWQREVDFEEDLKSQTIENKILSNPVAAEEEFNQNNLQQPEIKEVSQEDFEKISNSKVNEIEAPASSPGKEDWL